MRSFGQHVTVARGEAADRKMSTLVRADFEFLCQFGHSNRSIPGRYDEQVDVAVVPIIAAATDRTRSRDRRRAWPPLPCTVERVRERRRRQRADGAEDPLNSPRGRSFPTVRGDVRRGD